MAREVEVELPGSELPLNINSIIITDYIRYIFNFAIAIAGLIVFGVLVFAGLKAMLSSQNPSALSDAKSQITDAVIGLIIILSAYLILTTLNPQLVLINPEIKGVNQGIILYHKPQPPSASGFNIAKDQKTITSSQGDLGDFQATHYKFVTDPAYLKVSVFSGPNFSTGELTLASETKETPISGIVPKSIKLEYQLPGVYLCKGGEQQKTCKVYQSSTGQIDKDFEDKITSVELKNPFKYDDTITDKGACEKMPGGHFYGPEELDSEGKPLGKPLCKYDTDQYGAVLHEATNYRWTCDVFTFNTELPKDGVKREKFPGDGVSSLTVFLRPDASEAPRPTNKGVTLFEDISYAGGEKSFGPGEHLDFTKIQFDPNPNEKTNIDNKISSLRVEAGNIALLFWNKFSDAEKKYGGDCEIFTANDPDLGIDNNKIEDNASSLKVIPIKK